MLAQVWSAVTRRPQPTREVWGAQLEPIVKYRLAVYLTTTSANPTSQPLSTARRTK